MRKIMMFDNVSADGYYATTDGGLDWVVQDPEQQAAAVAALPGSDTVLFGRKTYELFASFWPHALDGASPHGAASAATRSIATFLNAATKIVFSTTLTEVSWQGSRIARTIDPHELAAMKQQPGKDMIIFGSGSVVSRLTELGLIDEYQLVVNPVLLGRGRPWLELSNRVKLELVASHAYTTSGGVMVRYRRAS
jgi:dihydrofolate reductase